jgi:hypothetical protein
MIQAFLCYVVNVYSDGLKLYKLLDPLSQQIIQGGIYNDHRPDSRTLEKLHSYVQVKEKEGSNFKENWNLVETSAGLISTIFN